MNINVRAVYMIMARKAMNQSDIARNGGLTRQQVSTVLIRKTCSAKTLHKFAVALGVDPGELIVMEGI